MKVTKPEVKLRKAPITKSVDGEKVRGRQSKPEVAAPVVPQTLGKATRQETLKHRESILKRGKHQRAGEKHGK